ncbi:Sulfide dehydrogenase (flavocytochrome C) flavoprotein chain precursor [Methylophaga frappieri]|uniref:Sulfide dehydrogenase (Flavocytochrome C) flavoprotein chain n=1 Tax=Methylophaga frappieri (strain ATCC BAA-2434 / DSM 25690 / JAM7) TaxID=754477 RepID=I1YHC5_METFJ|nr:FCSD flavin-binding domain-containing protein [Methylophaga frappieri]AFJ02318.1 Sulfide dehydrogenase (flavocytochrome C) flavoprotein chain precursor [Methylophaga frappieri]
MSHSRRQFLKSAALSGLAATLPISLGSCRSAKKAKVVVIGGGYAGATAARYLALWAPEIEIILIEKQTRFISCPQSNLVLSGSRQLTDLTHSYETLASLPSIQLIQDEVTAIDADKKKVYLTQGDVQSYDRLIIAPGVSLDYHNLPMLQSATAQQKVPHAWKAGSQTQLLAQQLQAMRPGGTVIMTVPQAPYRCPPGPYERACQIALYLKRHNPKGKLLILDANPDIISKKSLFVEAWQTLYPNLIDYLPTHALDSVDVDNLAVETLFGDYRADVLNVIPPQQAGAVAEMAGVVNIDQRWCDVNFLTYESTAIASIHVIGDAVAAKTPKSGHVANQQAKVCAAAVISLLREEQPEPQPVFSNTCYSFVDDKQAMHVANVYRYDAKTREMRTMNGGGVSKTHSETEGRYAQGWAENIWSDMLGELP